VAKLLKVVSRLYVSWIYLVVVVGVVGFIFTSIIVIHDSYVAGKALKKVKEIYPDADEHGDLINELDKISRKITLSESDVRKQIYSNSGKSFIPDEYLEQVMQLEDMGFSVSSDSANYSVHLKNRWGDSDFSNISFLWACSLWLVGSALILIISILLRKWILYLIKD